MPTTTAPAKNRLIAAASILGYQESVQVLSGHMHEELTKTLLKTPLKDLPAALSRTLGPLSTKALLAQTPMADLQATLSRVIGRLAEPTTTSPKVMAPVKRSRTRSTRHGNQNGGLSLTPIAVTQIVEKPEGFFMELNDGRTYRSTRRRDLVRRAKQLGLSIPG